VNVEGRNHCLWNHALALTESCDQLLKEHNLAMDYLRVRAYPFTRTCTTSSRIMIAFTVVEQNRDAQCFQLIKLDMAATR